MIAVCDVVPFLFSCLQKMIGGEIFIPKMKTILIRSLPAYFRDDAEIKYIGLQNGERLHEILITKDDVRNTYENEASYLIIPQHGFWEKQHLEKMASGYQKIKRDEELNSSHCPLFDSDKITQLLTAYRSLI